MDSHDLPPLGAIVKISKHGREHWGTLRRYNIRDMEVVGYDKLGCCTLCWSPLLEKGFFSWDVGWRCNPFLERGALGYWWLEKKDYTYAHTPLSIEECM